MRSRRSILRSVGAFAAGSALVFAGLVVEPTATSAQAGNPDERGPAPTAASIRANGTFNVSQQSVPSSASGFGGGTIYYPTDSSQDYGAVAVSPGFLTPGSLMAGWAQRLASHGFVAMAMNTNTTGDFPDSRADQLRAALDYMISNSTVGSRIDEDRLGVMGHSMGGGGSLIAADEDPRIDAAVPLQPWNLGNFPGMDTPTMIIGAQNDAVAGVGSHSEPFYQSIPNSTPKAYLELAGQAHGVGLSTSNANQAGSALSWMKRFVDNDTRYDQFLCPAPSGSGISEYRENCPYPGGSGGTTTTGPGGTTTTGPGGGGQCFEATNSQHRDAGRAEGFFFLTAVGSGDSLGLWFSQTSLRQTSPGTWSLVDSC